MKLTLLFLLVLIAETGYSQTLSSKKHYLGDRYWYPYYENGKTGWVNLGRDGHIKPSSITQVDHPFVYTHSGRVGLIDTSGKLLLDTIYNSLDIVGESRIYDYNPASDTLFSFRIDLERSGVVSSTGRQIAMPGYSVKFLTNNLIVFESDTYSDELSEPPLRDHRIYSVQKGAWLPYIFDEVNFTGYDPVVAKVKDKSGRNRSPISFLIDRTGEIIQKMPYASNDVWIWPYQNNYEDGIHEEVSVILLVTPEMAYVYQRNRLIDSIKVVNEPMEFIYRIYPVSFPMKSRFPVKKPINILINYNRDAQIETNSGVTAYDLETGDTLWHSRDTIRFFSEYQNISVVTSKGKFGMYNDWESPIFPLIFDSLIQMEGTYNNYIHTSWSAGKKVSFKAKYSIAVKDPLTGKFALADSSLRVVTPYEYDTIYWEHISYFYKTILVKNGLQGIADEHCKIIIPVEYDTIMGYQSSNPNEKRVVAFILKKGKETAFAGSDGKVIWKGNYPVANVISATEPVLIEYGETDKRGVMTAEGTIVLKTAYLKIEYNRNGFIVYTIAGVGIRSVKDKQVLRSEFLNIKPIRDTTHFYMVFDKQGMRIYNAAKKKFIGSHFNGLNMTATLTGKDTFTIHSDFYPKVSEYPYKNNQAVIHADGTSILPFHSGRIRDIFRFYSDSGFFLTDVNGKVLTSKYDWILYRENLFLPEEDPYTNFCESNRYFVLTKKDTLAIFDAWSSTLLEKTNVSLFLSNCDTDSTSGIFLLQDKEGIEIYNSDLTKLSPLKFDRYDQGAMDLENNRNGYFMTLPVFYLYRENMRYTYDRRTNTLSGPVNTENDAYDIDGRLVVEDYDAIEKINGLSKIRKGSKIYWFTADRLLFHISEVNTN